VLELFFKKKLFLPKGDLPPKSQDPIPETRELMSSEFKKRLQHSADILENEIGSSGISIFSIGTLIDKTMFHQDIINPIKDLSFDSIQNVMEHLSVGEIKKTDQMEKVVKAALDGNVIIYLEGEPSVLLAKIPSRVGRSLTFAENESHVIGPQIAFNESLMTNISLIRNYIKDPDLSIEDFVVGSRTNKSGAILYISGIASEQMVNTLRKRIDGIIIDGILDSSILLQLIEDKSLSLFPLMSLTERPDRVCDLLLKGKLAILVDGSSLAVICPHTFMEFFQAQEDSNVNWQVGTFYRLLRLIALFFSVFLTATYVACITFHYEVIPQTLLLTLSESRAKVPFPPIMEALLLEFFLELLREAGARLPTKVGQTMGIVGGIVIGTAAVEAGFTSNILIIIIALAALGSFVTPSYSMGNVIRLLRFPLIILAGFWGLYGIMYGFCFLLLHLLRQSSLGSPYLAPFYPPRFADWKDSIIRLPLSFTYKRPDLTKPGNENKYDPEKAKEKN
jgi:Bacillus/Clostridium GerA spore germination protein